MKRKSTGFCATCKCKLLIPSWIYCNACDPRIYKKNKKEKVIEIKIEKIRKNPLYRQVLIFDDFDDVQKIYKIAHNFKGIPLKDKKILIHDENDVIIGWK